MSGPGDHIVATSQASCSKERRRLVTVLFSVALVLMLGKVPGMPTSQLFMRVASLEDLPLRMRPHLEYILFTPLATIVVVLFRLTLGLEVYGLWRPILLAVAFRLVGLQIGLTFLLTVMLGIVLVWPLLRVSGLHSYARQSVALGSVVMVLLAAVVVGARFHIKPLLRTSHFPIISLCLISENFAMTLYKKGLHRAVRRGTATILAGIIISLVFKIPGAVPLLLRFPELLIAQIGCIVMIAEFFNLRLLGAKSSVMTKPAASTVCQPAGYLYETSGWEGEQ